jgi:uncharacterized protein (TIGR02598 family)
MRAPSAKSRGFSLAEVVMALGLFAFCVVAIVGLLGVGLGATRSVANECAAVNIAESIYGGWQAQQDPTKPLTVTNLFTNLPPLAGTSSRDLYFDGSGVQVAGSAEGAFEVRYAVSSGVAIPNQPLASTLQLDFRWPPGAPTNAAQTRSYTRIFVKTP